MIPQEIIALAQALEAAEEALTAHDEKVKAACRKQDELYDTWTDAKSAFMGGLGKTAADFARLLLMVAEVASDAKPVAGKLTCGDEYPVSSPAPRLPKE